MIPDWPELEQRLFTLALGAIESFARTAPNEEFYGFHVDVHPRTGQVLFSLNSEEALRRQIVWYRMRWPDRYSVVDDALLAGELRWNLGDWHYQGLQCEGWDEVWDAFRTAIAQHRRDTDQDQRDGAGRLGSQLREAVRRVVLRLEQSGAFAPLKTTTTFRCLCDDLDKMDQDSADRLTHCHWLRQSPSNAQPTPDA